MPALPGEMRMGDGRRGHPHGTLRIALAQSMSVPGDIGANARARIDAFEAAATH